MKLANLETILLTSDLTPRADLYCLSCRRRLAVVSCVDRFDSAGSPTVGLSVSQLSEYLRDFQQSRWMVNLTCGCSVRSTYHWIQSTTPTQ